MQTFDPSYIPRPKHCKDCNHILGVVMRFDDNRIGLSRKLFIFNNAIEVLPDVDVLMDVKRGMYKIHGLDSCDGIECSNCGALNSWSLSDEAMRNLMRHFKVNDSSKIYMPKVKVMSNA